MNIDVKLTQGSTALCNVIEPLVLPEEELVLNVSTDIYDIKTLVVTVRNGKKQKQFKLIDFKPLDLKEFLFGGIIEIEISAVLKGHVVKSWRVPDITITEIEHFFSVIPEIERLRLEYASKFTEVYSALNEIKNIIKEM